HPASREAPDAVIALQNRVAEVDLFLVPIMIAIMVRLIVVSTAKKVKDKAKSLGNMCLKVNACKRLLPQPVSLRGALPKTGLPKDEVRLMTTLSPRELRPVTS